jgi:hypothetical protein
MLILTAVLTLVFGTAAFAETVTQNIRVEFNKREIADGGLLVDNKTYLAAGTLARAMQALVFWDNDAKKVTINKPNVHMFTMKDNATFGSVLTGRTKFLVFAQIDSLYTDISAFKVTITNPYGEEMFIDGRNSADRDFPTKKQDFWFKTREISYDFAHVGPYTIRFWMQTGEDSPMQVVAEKVISSK